MVDPNPNFDSYWLFNNSSGILSEQLPCQAIPSSSKNKDFIKKTLDALEIIGINQIKNDNSRFFDYYRMYKGDMSYMELSEVIPQLREVEQFLGDCEIPSFLRHYDLLGVIINTYIGWLGEYDDKYIVTSSDEVETNAYLREKKEQLTGFVKESLDRELNLRLLQRGIDPFSWQSIENEEQRQQIIQAINQEKSAMTPPEIESFMQSTWKTGAVMLGNETLKADRERFFMDDLDKENNIDILIAGRAFREHKIYFDCYKPKRWSPKNTFFSKTLDSKFPQYGEYIGRIHYYAPSEFINEYGHKLKKNVVRKILEPKNNSAINSSKRFSNSFYPWESRMVPFAGYDDYNMIRAAESYTNVPFGWIEEMDSEGNMVKKNRFLPGLMSNGNFTNPQFMDTGYLRNDLIQTTEVYWVSYKLMYYITYLTPEGLIAQEIVTDDLIKDFLRENGIKEVSRTLEEYTDDPEINTYITFYIPEVRHGVKARTFNTSLGEDLYIGGEPLEYQIPGESNFFDFQIPVSSIVTESSLADKIFPYQAIYNLAINQLVNLMEKEIGLFFLFDINYLPSEYKKYADTGEALDTVMSIAKQLSVFGMDMGKQNANSGSGGTPFNQFAAIDLSLTGQMNSRIQLANFAKSMLYESLGLTPQALGAFTGYESGEGIKQGLNSSLVQMQVYGDDIDVFHRRTLDQHLCVALYCKSKGKDVSIMYTNSDLTRSFLYLKDPDLPLRRLNVFPMSNSRNRRKFEDFQRMLLQINTAGSDELSLAQIIASDSMTELISAARNSAARRERIAELNHQRNLELQQNQASLLSQQNEIDFNQKVEIEHIKGGYKLEEERINALGRAADKNSDVLGIREINRAADISMKSNIAERKMDLEEERAQMDDAERSANIEIKMEELRLAAEQLKQRTQDNKTKLITSTINKN